jgi:putative transcriptional regulator
MMTARYHPCADTLFAYGSGSLDEAFSLLVASHLAYCPLCRRDLSHIEAVGGELLEQGEPMALRSDALAAALARLNGTPQAPARAVPGPQELPPALRSYLGGGLSSVRWKRLGRGLEQSLLFESRFGSKARLLRIAPGLGVPEHTHAGDEATLVLQGGFSDAAGDYGPGDVAWADASVTHRPLADPGKPCICLAVTNAPLRLTGLTGLLINPFLNI